MCCKLNRFLNMIHKHVTFPLSSLNVTSLEPVGTRLDVHDPTGNQLLEVWVCLNGLDMAQKGRVTSMIAKWDLRVLNVKIQGRYLIFTVCFNAPC